MAHDRKTIVLTFTIIRTSNTMILALFTHVTLSAWGIQLNMGMMRLTKEKCGGRNRWKKQTERWDHKYTDIICTGIFFHVLKNFVCISRVKFQ